MFQKLRTVLDTSLMLAILNISLTLPMVINESNKNKIG